ncbi:MAG: RsbRD N-terminal domain-containing protein [Thermodesulfovibrionales bacterium]|nr:RsbRD N-terminal domain-containing protein [Thermodesulfovibrionales bacterium]
MNLKDLLLKKKSSIVEKWFNSIINNYPSDSSHFLKKQKDCFLNPVGHTISQNIDGLFDEILHGVESEKVYPYLDDIIKINAVQDFSPSKAASFIYLLKQVVRDELESDIRKNKLSEELKSFETQLDNLTFLSFDIYMKCRERIFELRVNEIKNMTYGLLKRANLISEIEEHESDIKTETVLTQNIKG